MATNTEIAPRSLVLYRLYRGGPGSDHQSINTPFGAIHIRVEAVEKTLGDALDTAAPRPGEHILNTIPAPL